MSLLLITEHLHVKCTQNDNILTWRQRKRSVEMDREKINKEGEIKEKSDNKEV